MDIKEANISETDTGFRTNGCGFVFIQVVPLDPKVHKLTTISPCMDGGCILNKLDIPKSIRLSTLLLSGGRGGWGVSQRNKGQMYVNHNDTSVAFLTMVHLVILNVCIRSSFHFLMSKCFDRPKSKRTPIVSESNMGFSGIKVLATVFCRRLIRPNN